MSVLARLWGRDTEQRTTLSFTAGGMLPWDMLWQGVTTTYGSLTGSEEPLPSDFAGLADYAFKSHPVVFAAIALRMMIFSEARFQWQALERGRTGHLFGNQALEILERPWPRGATPDLLSRTMQDADIGGNALWARRPATRLAPAGRLKRLRPDWTVMVLGVPGDMDPDDTVDPIHDLDAEVIGYAYTPGGVTSGNSPEFIPESEVVHFAPIPDPTATHRGMSWLVPILSEVASDRLAVEHKAKYFQNAATPNLVVKIAGIDDPTKFQEWVDAFEAAHAGSANAYKTLYLTAAVDPQVVGNDFQQMDFRNLSAQAESRIAMAALMPGTVLGTSEGMQGSSLNAGNYAQARRRLADGTMRPYWRKSCSAFQYIVERPQGANRLWYDAADIPFLEEDEKDAAEIRRIDATTVRNLLDAGYTPKAAKQFLATNGDPEVLEHSGLFSVQLQKPGGGPPITASVDGPRLKELLEAGWTVTGTAPTRGEDPE